MPRRSAFKYPVETGTPPEVGKEEEETRSLGKTNRSDTTSMHADWASSTGKEVPGCATARGIRTFPGRPWGGLHPPWVAPAPQARGRLRTAGLPDRSAAHDPPSVPLIVGIRYNAHPVIHISAI